MYSIAILGGTFDPIHFGHLRPALELSQLGFDEVRLMPCHIPVHRNTPCCTAEQRLAMAELAVSDENCLRIDHREIARDGVSYTIDTLMQLRNELGDDVSLNLVMGMDVFCDLDTWHQWEKLIHLANIVVTERPGSAVPDDGVMANFLDTYRAHRVDQLLGASSGHVLLQQLTLLDISAMSIRRIIAQGKSPKYLLPDLVLGYIEQHRLYRKPSGKEGLCKARK